MEKVEVIVHEGMDPRYSADIQRSLARSLNGIPNMLVYDFESAFLGLGCSQTVKEVAPNALDGIDKYPIVRRLTSGGASAHAFDNSVCFVVLERLKQPSGNAWLPNEETISRLGTAIQNYVRDLGIVSDLFRESRTYGGRSQRSYYVGDKEGRFLAALASGVYTYYNIEGRNSVQVTQGCLRVRPLEDLETPVLAMSGYDKEDVETLEKVLGSVSKSDRSDLPSLREIARGVSGKFSGRCVDLFDLDVESMDISDKWMPNGGIAKLGLCELRRKEKFEVGPI